MHRFLTKADALAAGYRYPSESDGDRDVSPGDSYGYAWEAQDGRRSVTVWLINETNKGGARGAFAEMFPPPALPTGGGGGR